MSIDVMSTEIGVKLRKVRLLSDTVVWYDSNDGFIRNQILKWIQNDQLRSRGIDEYGDVIGWYSQMTEILSGGRKKFNTHYTLEDTGQFFRGMFVIVLKDSLVIDSDGAEKEDENLFDKYGVGIVGLTDENMEKLVTLLRAKYIARTRKMLELD